MRKPDVSPARFDPTDESLRAALAALLPHLSSKRYRRGRTLWTEGEVSGQLTILDRGRVKILHSRPEGVPVLLYVFGPGELFGFLPLLDGGPYPATAVALDDVEARVLPRARLLSLVRQEPKVSLLLLAALSQRLREAFDRMEQLSRRDALGRVAAGLMTLVPEELGGKAPPVIELPEAASRFSEEVGVTAETFSRAATRLTRLKVLHRLGSGRWQVLDLPRLATIAAGHPPGV